MIETDCDPTAVDSHGATLLQVAWRASTGKYAGHERMPKQISGLSSTAITQLLEIKVLGEDTLYVACSHGNSTVPP